MKSLRFSCHHNPLQISFHYSEIILGIKGFILYQIKQTALNSSYNFSTCGKFANTS